MNMGSMQNGPSVCCIDTNYQLMLQKFNNCGSEKWYHIHKNTDRVLSDNRHIYTK